MERNGLNVLGLGEVRWRKSGDYWSDKYRVIYSGGEKDAVRGVAIVLDEETGKRVKKVVQYSDRVMLVKIEAEPRDIVAVQVYMPTSASDDEKVDEVYEQINDLIEAEKDNDYLVLMGDWNAVIGEGEQGREIGKYGHGKRNERGEKLVEFCRAKKLMATNTWFEQENRRRYTWKQPGDIRRYQLDY